MVVVVKIGTSSLTDSEGIIRRDAIVKLCLEVAAARAAGHQVVIVTSGAIGAGLPALGLGGDKRPRDAQTLQAVSAVGQSRLMGVYSEELDRHSLVGGQVLLAPLDFVDRRQYLQARGTLTRLLELGVIPIVNENDAVADDEIRFGDNDRLAALVSHLVDAELLVLLTDTSGLLSADPRVDPDASLIEEIVEFDQQLDDIAGGPGTPGGSGGMASKVSAAKIAAWSGVRTVIAAAHREDVLLDAINGVAGVGTTVAAHERDLPARKLWIAFAVRSSGLVSVDAGARKALERGGTSLLAAGVVGVSGEFDVDDAVEIADESGEVFAKGLVRMSSTTLTDASGHSRSELPVEVPAQVVHADDLVILP
jgi:glutamate 5-kinase